MLLKMIFCGERESLSLQLSSLVRFPEAGPAALPIREAGRGGLGFPSWAGVRRLHQRLAQPSALCVPVSTGCSEPGALTLAVFGTHR